MKVKVTIHIHGVPLRRAYVEHIVLGVGTDMYMTDDDGRVRNRVFDEGIDSLTSNADIRIICQNAIVRVNDGDNLNIGVYQDKSIRDGDAINLHKNREQDDYYSLLNRAQDAYDLVFKHLRFFRNLADPDFPLGAKASLRDTRDQAKRIDVVYPDYSVAALAWTEPKRLLDNFPLIHIKRRDIDSRLFGESGAAPILVPHELTHALHFSMLTETQRGNAQDKYAEFILSSPLTGLGPFHSFAARTTAEVAYIEAGGLYGENFMEFLRLRQPDPTSTLVQPVQVTEPMQAEFVAEQWSRVTIPSPILTILNEIRSVFLGTLRLLGVGRTPPGPKPASPTRFRLLPSRAFLNPSVTGGDVEGAVYSAIFVDFARVVGLDFAASSYFAANAITFGEYRAFINDQHPQHADALEAARVFWGL